MRVRKRTSKRTSTRMREGIQKKATAHRRKERKFAKTDVTWKSKHKKDPGIPANFPYKHKILEEIEAKKQRDLEEKRLAREEKKRAREQALAIGEEVMDEDDIDEDDGHSGLAALADFAQQAAADFDGTSEATANANGPIEYESRDLDINFYDDDDEGDSELEQSRKAYDKIFKTVVDASDVILYVLDARDPEGTRSRKVEQEVLQSQGKRLILILNKVDLVPPHVLEQWLNVLKSSFPTIPIRAAPGATNSTSFNKKLTQSATANALLEALKTYSNNSNLKRSIVVGVIGYPNVGKSSIINAITSRRGGPSKVCPTGNQPGVTTALREIKIDSKLKILDSPGICFPGETKAKSKVEQEAELALLSALPPKFILDPYPAILMLVKRLSKSNEMTESFKKLYEIPPIPANDADTFTKHFLIYIARKRGRLGKGGIPNLASAGLSVLNDWRDGKILGWVLPNASKETPDASQSNVSTSTSTGTKSAPSKAEQTTIVSEWSKEFDLDGLFGSLDAAIGAANDQDADMA
ncbi:similar to Saccharomyces cerevisiae YER006W NUG1 GTPase that associates with nuclear 60S pre-ribosomes, required for export of 60S ribosomal subunits from the nucleus [Maudiozyma barnettii]|nr:similar to Saccharomyces cerevisiae YER006W NUG1 GTPase that associates with nuclear 60S pre-ribosomes, required for export of 60S ribosomal subunits from the nucleus [Kazachstania barnettii]